MLASWNIAQTNKANDLQSKMNSGRKVIKKNQFI